MNRQYISLLVSVLALGASSQARAEGGPETPQAPASVGDAPASKASPAPSPKPTDVGEVRAASDKKEAPSGLDAPALVGEAVESVAVRTERISLELFTRAVYARDDGFGVFTTSKSISHGGLALRVPVFRAHPWSVSVGASVEGRDGLEARVRDATARVEFTRPLARGEVAYAFTSNLDGVASVGLGAERMEFSYDTGLERAGGDSWRAAADASLGGDAHWRLGPLTFGIRFEGGVLAARGHVVRAPRPEVGVVVRQPVDLGTLASSGNFLRFGLRVGY